MAMRETPYRQVKIEEIVTDAKLREILSGLNEIWEPERARHETASRLASGMLILFGFVVAYSGIVTSILSIICGEPEKGLEQMREFVNMLLPYITTPLGIALGYFFRGSQGE